MKATLEFNLPEEESEFNTALCGHKYKQALSDVASHLRHLYKYTNLPEEQYKLVMEIRGKFYEILQEYELDLDK